MKEYKIFSPNPDPQKTIVINWRFGRDNDQREDMLTTAKAYSDAAVFLMKTVLADNIDKKGDSMIFPILFSINQWVELNLKVIQWTLNVYNYRRCDEKVASEKFFTETHNILGLLNDIKSKIQKCQEHDIWKWKECKVFFKSTDEYISELYNVAKIDPSNYKDQYITFTRYPMLNKEHSAFYVNPDENIYVDVEYLYCLFEEMQKDLSIPAEYCLEIVSDELFSVRKMTEKYLF